MISHYVKGIVPAVNIFAGTIYSQVVNLKYYGAVEFIVFRGVGATGTALFTVEACKDLAASQVAPVEFSVVRVNPGDTHSAPVFVTSYTTPAGGSDVIIIKIRAAALASSGWTYARLKSVEQTVSPVSGAILIRMEEARYGQTAAMTGVVLTAQEQAELEKQQAKAPVPPVPGPPSLPVPPVPPAPKPTP